MPPETEHYETAAPVLLAEAALAFAMPLLLYLLLARSGFYEVDGQSLVHWLALGEGNHDRHILFLPLARILAAPLLACGLTPFQALRAISAIGMALAVFFFWAAALRLGRSRSERGLLVAATAASPALLFFASIVEFHGLFLAFAGLAWFCEACLERSKKPLFPAAAMGLVTGLAALVHGTGQLLGPLLPLFFLLRARVSGRSLRQDLAWALVALLCHALVVQGLGLWLRPEGTQGQGHYILSSLAYLPPLSELGSDLLFEWVLAFLPVSLLCWWSFRIKAYRSQTLWLLTSVSLYVLLSWILVPGMHERGAYLLPLVYPAGLLALSISPRWPLVALTLFGLGYGIMDLRRVEISAGSSVWSQALVQVEAEQKGFYLLGDQTEIDALLIRQPDLPYDHFENTVTLLRQGKLDAPMVGLLLLGLSTAQKQQGRSLYLSESAWSLLELPDEAIEATRREIQRTFLMERIERDGFVAWRLQAR